MQKEIQEVIDWNIEAGNTPDTFNKHLEASMLAEEFAETIIALKNKDTIEALDGIIDMFWIGIGTLYKMGLTSNQIENAFNEITKSNYSKFVEGKCLKDSSGKILKPDTYFNPNLKDIIGKKES